AEDTQSDAEAVGALSEVIPPSGPRHALTFYSVAACREGAPPPGVFTKSAAALGIDFVHEPNVVDEEGMLVMDFGGVGIADLDGDKFLDLYFTNAGGPDRVFLTQGRGPAAFRGYTPGVPQSQNLVVSLADLDGDGDVDALVARDEAGWLENDGSGQFVAFRPIAPGIVAAEHTVFGFTTGDLNSDGWLDVLTSVHEVVPTDDDREWPGAEWLHTGSPVGLVDATASVPNRAVEDWTFLTALSDFDSDGDLDLYEFNDAFSLAVQGLSQDDFTRQGNRVVENRNGTLVDRTDDSSGAIIRTAMGGATGDYDNDGLIDVYVTTMRPETNALLHNDGDFQFTDVAFDLDADTLDDSHDVGWGAVFFDADSDGWLDLFVAHGFLTDFDHDIGPVNAAQQSDVLLRNSGMAGQTHAGFRNISEQAAITGPGWSRSPSVGDLNRDGFVDLVVGTANGPPAVYLNGCDDRPQLTIRLVGSGPNSAGIGARVTVSTASKTQVREIQGGGSGLYGSSAPEATFGFATGTKSVDLSIRWPAGGTSSWNGIEVGYVIEARPTTAIEPPSSTEM
ncbi:MAG: hypothetical protein ACI9OJ_004430, partial [Myxococcota bacterium]